MTEEYKKLRDEMANDYLAEPDKFPFASTTRGHYKAGFDAAYDLQAKRIAELENHVGSHECSNVKQVVDLQKRITELEADFGSACKTRDFYEDTSASNCAAFREEQNKTDRLEKEYSYLETTLADVEYRFKNVSHALVLAQEIIEKERKEKAELVAEITDAKCNWEHFADMTKELTQERDALKARVAELEDANSNCISRSLHESRMLFRDEYLIEALRFYADKKNWDFTDHENEEGDTGEMGDKIAFSDVETHDDETTPWIAGKRAREVLAKAEGRAE
jgi:hypothetical protein